MELRHLQVLLVCAYLGSFTSFFVGATPAAEGGGGGKKKKQKEPRVTISTQQRQKRKFITVVDGLESCGLWLLAPPLFALPCYVLDGGHLTFCRPPHLHAPLRPAGEYTSLCRDIGVKLAEAAKFFGKHFSCGASVTARETGTGEEIVIQGDVTDELPDILIERWQVPEAAIIVQERKEKREKKR